MFPPNITWGWQTKPIETPNSCHLWQYHSQQVCQASPTMTHRADAHWTSETNLSLCVRTADCLPILLAHPNTPWIAAIHAGWRGLNQNIIHQTLQLAPKPQNQIIAWIGPCIHAPSFAFDAKTAPQLFPKHSIIQKDGNCFVDLIDVAKQQLHDHHIHLITTSLLDTYSCSFLPSYRRNPSRQRIHSWIRLQSD